MFDGVGLGEGGAEELVAQAVFGVEALRDEGDGEGVGEDGGCPWDGGEEGDGGGVEIGWCGRGVKVEFGAEGAGDEFGLGHGELRRFVEVNVGELDVAGEMRLVK